MSRTTTRRAAPVVAALAASLAAAAPAAAQSETRAEIDDGRTVLRLDRATAAALTGAGIRVSATRPARLRSSGLSFPVSGGSADPRSLRGSVSHRGGIALRAGQRRVVLGAPRYRIGARRATLSARVGGSRLTILNLDTRRAELERDGLTTEATGLRATLTRTAARALNRAFHTRLFSAGLRLGTVRSEVEFAEVLLAEGATELALDPAAAALLQTLGVTATPVAPSTGLSFAITGGRLNPERLTGSIAHSGGIALARGTTRIELRDFGIELGERLALEARVGNARIAIATLDVGALQRGGDEDTLVLSGVVARLTETAATALNGLFQTTAFREGVALGTATVTAELL